MAIILNSRSRLQCEAEGQNWAPARDISYSLSPYSLSPYSLSPYSLSPYSLPSEARERRRERRGAFAEDAAELGDGKCGEVRLRPHEAEVGEQVRV